MAKRTAEEAEQTRRTILRTAQALFSERGFAATRTIDIARTSGFSEGAVFHHYPDKTLLFRAVVDRLQQLYVADIYETAMRDDDPMRRFLNGTRRSLELSINSDYLRIVMLEAGVVLGATGWREMDARVGLSLIEPNLIAVSGRDDLPEAQIKPMALMVMGLVNETIYALARGDGGVSIDGTIILLERATNDWIARLPPMPRQSKQPA